MQNDPSENEQVFRDLVNSIIGQPDNTMDPCFDASVVEKYLEQNSKNKIFYLGSKIVEVGRTNVVDRGLAHYIKIEGPDEYKNYILWPSTSLGDGHDGLCLYQSQDFNLDEQSIVDSDTVTDLIFLLSDLISESAV